MKKFKVLLALVPLLLTSCTSTKTTKYTKEDTVRLIVYYLTEAYGDQCDVYVPSKFETFECEIKENGKVIESLVVTYKYTSKNSQLTTKDYSNWYPRYFVTKIE